jgi:TonB family protein
MNASYFDSELARIRSRTRKSTGASIVLHVLLFLGIYLMRSASPQAEALVEVSWMEPNPGTPGPAPSGFPAEKSVVPTRSVRKVPEYFVRESSEGDVTADPQISRAYQDRLDARLSSLQSDAVEKRSRMAALATSGVSGVVMGSNLAGIPGGGGGSGGGGIGSGTPGGLYRAGTGTGKPGVLRRAPVRASAPVLAVAKTQQVQAAPEPAKPADTATRRTLAGAQLSGPVADRPLISYSTPVYPEWAKREGVEGTTKIYFVVLPDGKIKENIVVEKTSGFEDFDHNAAEALLAWHFQPLPDSQTGEQWGRITFHYRLSSIRTN